MIEAIKNFKFFLLFLPLLFIGCGNSEIQSSEKVASHTQQSDKNVINSDKEKEFLNELGFNFDNEKISFDINKTNNFFKKMQIEMHGKADEIQHKIEKADINFTRDIGLTLKNEKVSIDLNKTRKMFQEINILMKEVLLDNNSSKY
ncbi:MAG: Unknown protein [uncultured Sulfurovum sp.]|uniref:Lipoprotein n=1 Tax=uncultured Sulfurovum sp. TaxID=269237 RepID=A0A6S6SLR0_9BACT|nr:MAG: Unknown protein [uncultured Sulfurovum sp.]